MNIYKLNSFCDGVMNVSVFSSKDNAEEYAKKNFGKDYKKADKEGKKYSKFLNGEYDTEKEEKELEKVYSSVEEKNSHLILFYIEKDILDPKPECIQVKKIQKKMSLGRVSSRV